MICRNLLEIYKKYKITEEISLEEYGATQLSFHGILTKAKLPHNTPLTVLSKVCEEFVTVNKNMTCTFLGIRGRFLFPWTGSWDGYEEESSRLFRLSSGIICCSIIEIIEDLYSARFEDALNNLDVPEILNKKINDALDNLIRGQLYYGFYMPNTHNHRRSRKVWMYELKVREIQFPEYDFTYSYSYSHKIISVYFKNNKSGKELRSSEDSGMIVTLSEEMRELRLRSIKSRWLNNYTRDIQMVNNEIKNYTKELRNAKTRRDNLELEFKNFETRTNKLLGI